MHARILAPVVAAAGLLVSTGAFADIPAITQCSMYKTELMQDVSEIHFHTGTPANITEAVQKANTLCAMGNAQEGVEVLKAAIASLGVPVREH